MSLLRVLPACALLGAVPARAADAPSVEFAPRFIDVHARAGLIVSVGATAPLLSATAVFGEMLAVDLSGFYVPLPGSGADLLYAALQAGPNFRFGSRNARGAGAVTDLRLLAGVDVTTGELETFPPRVVYIPAIICGVAVEWTRWMNRLLGVSAELAPFAGFSPPAGGVIGLRASVGLAF